MSIAVRRIARASLLALMAGFAPAASAVGQSDDEIQRAAEEAERGPALSRAAAQAASEMAAPGEIDVMMKEVVRSHIEAQEDRRVGIAIDAEAAKLKPGKYVWRPDRADSGPVDVVVSIKAQRAYVFRQNKLIAISTVSTGRKGNDTPTGSFPILQKKRMHHSNLYNNAPMPNMQRMTWDGVALHAGNIPGYPASHGCVRLPMEFSKLLFGVTRIGSTVHVVDDEPSSGLGALAFAQRAAAHEHASTFTRTAERFVSKASGTTQPARAR
jgi:lipoprotein-anchoring transpeptidase ErfK/SrfK